MKLLLSLALCGAMAAANSPMLRFKAANAAGGIETATVQFQTATGHLLSSNDIEYNGDTFTGFSATIAAHATSIDDLDSRLTDIETAVATVEASIVTMGNTITNHVAIAATDTELATAIANVQLLTTNGTGTSESNTPVDATSPSQGFEPGTFPITYSNGHVDTYVIGTNGMAAGTLDGQLKTAYEAECPGQPCFKLVSSNGAYELMSFSNGVLTAKHWGSDGAYCCTATGHSVVAATSEQMGFEAGTFPITYTNGHVDTYVIETNGMAAGTLDGQLQLMTSYNAECPGFPCFKITHSNGAYELMSFSNGVLTAKHWGTGGYCCKAIGHRTVPATSESMGFKAGTYPVIYTNGHVDKYVIETNGMAAGTLDGQLQLMKSANVECPGFPCFKITHSNGAYELMSWAGDDVSIKHFGTSGYCCKAIGHRTVPATSESMGFKAGTYPVTYTNGHVDTYVIETNGMAAGTLDGQLQLMKSANAECPGFPCFQLVHSNGAYELMSWAGDDLSIKHFGTSGYCCKATSSRTN